MVGFDSLLNLQIITPIDIPQKYIAQHMVVCETST